LYNTVKLHDAELKTSYLARSIMKDKLRNNGIVVMNTESFDYLTKDFTKNIEYKIERKIKLKYQDYISELKNKIIVLEK
ncbi:MAG: hypothetical protein KAG14_00130, partial [Mycoplasmataceae bacterium]|nr:hypothetical protein [Mycoplasmataceae bacterium]